MRDTVVFLNGCFDLLHVGHLHIIHKAVELAEGGTVIVGVNDDNSVLGRKAMLHRTLKERVKMINSLKGVSCVLSFGGKDATALVDAIKPDIYVTGQEYKGLSPEARLVQSYGGKVTYVARLTDYSTTNEAKKLGAKDA